METGTLPRGDKQGERLPFGTVIAPRGNRLYTRHPDAQAPAAPQSGEPPAFGSLRRRDRAGDRDQDRDCLLGLLSSKGLRREPEPVALSSGALSRDFVDVKRALASWPDLMCAARAVHGAAADAGVEFTAVGGTTMGADPLVFGVASLAGCRWFLVRGEPKQRGTRQLVEGAVLSEADEVLVVDDVATTGRSLLHAAEAARQAGARVAAAVAIVDRGETARGLFAEAGVRYLAVTGYADLGIAPV